MRAKALLHSTIALTHRFGLLERLELQLLLAVDLESTGDPAPTRDGWCCILQPQAPLNVTGAPAQGQTT